MPRRFLFLVLAAALIPAALRAQEPEKKPDAFEYFFGKKREEKKEAPAREEAPAPAEKPAEPEPKAAPEPAPAPAAPAKPAAPAAAVKPKADEPKPEAPKVAAPKPEEPKGDAFRYFFGRTTQPAEVKTEEKTSGKEPVDAFEYFFGKDGKAGADEEKPKNPPPSR